MTDPVAAKGEMPATAKGDFQRGGRIQRILQLLEQFGIDDTDTLKHRLEDHDRWAKEVVANSVEIADLKSKLATPSPAPSSLERDWRKISEELLVANKRVQDLTTELAAEVLKT